MVHRPGQRINDYLGKGKKFLILRICVFVKSVGEWRA
jgi:hypothetical protein